METNSEKAVNKLALKLGNTLIDSGMKMIASAFHIKSKKIDGDKITSVVKQYFPKARITHLDRYYYTIPIETWRELISYDWLKTKKWVAEKRDCDNFSNAFASNMSMFYEINSVGRVYGKLYTKEGDFIAWHYWNVIIDNMNRLWFFEPRRDKLAESWYRGGDVIVGLFKYEPVHFYFG